MSTKVGFCNVLDVLICTFFHSIISHVSKSMNFNFHLYFMYVYIILIYRSVLTYLTNPKLMNIWIVSDF